MAESMMEGLRLRSSFVNGPGRHSAQRRFLSVADATQFHPGNEYVCTSVAPPCACLELARAVDHGRPRGVQFAVKEPRAEATE